MSSESYHCLVNKSKSSLAKILRYIFDDVQNHIESDRSAGQVNGNYRNIQGFYLPKLKSQPLAR